MEKVATKNTKSTKKTWPMVRLGDVCEFVRRGKSPIYCETSPYPMFAQKCNQPNGIFLDKCKFCEPAKYLKFDKEYRLQDKDILINSTGTGTLGRVGFFREEYLQAFNYESIVADSHVTIVRMNNQVLQEYLYLFMRQDFVYKWLNDIANGSTNQKELYPQHLVRLEFPLPPLSVQREIVARLEKELGEADALAAKFKEIAENADAEFKAELDETFKNVEGEKVRLGDVCEIKNGYTPKASELREAGDVPYFRISAMNFPGNERQMQCPTAWLVGKHRCFRSGSVVFPKNGGAVYTGKVRLLVRDSIVDLNTGVCSPIIDIDCDYLYYWITAYDIRSAIVEGTIPFVDFSKLNDVNFMLPQLTIQHDIVKRLDAAKKRCEKLKAAAERGLRAAEDLRKAILAEAFEQ